MLLSILKCKDLSGAQWNKVANILCMYNIKIDIYVSNFLSYRTNLTKNNQVWVNFKLDEKVSICNMEKKNFGQKWPTLQRYYVNTWYLCENFFNTELCSPLNFWFHNFLSMRLIIPPANEVAGVYSDPYVCPFVRPSVPPNL